MLFGICPCKSHTPKLWYMYGKFMVIVEPSILGVVEILCSWRLVLERKTGKEMPESLRLEF